MLYSSAVYLAMVIHCFIKKTITEKQKQPGCISSIMTLAIDMHVYI